MTVVGFATKRAFGHFPYVGWKRSSEILASDSDPRLTPQCPSSELLREDGLELLLHQYFHKLLLRVNIRSQPLSSKLLEMSQDIPGPSCIFIWWFSCIYLFHTFSLPEFTHDAHSVWNILLWFHLVSRHFSLQHWLNCKCLWNHFSPEPGCVTVKWETMRKPCQTTSVNPRFSGQAGPHGHPTDAGLSVSSSLLIWTK